MDSVLCKWMRIRVREMSCEETRSRGRSDSRKLWCLNQRLEVSPDLRHVLTCGAPGLQGRPPSSVDSHHVTPPDDERIFCKQSFQCKPQTAGERRVENLRQNPPAVHHGLLPPLSFMTLQLFCGLHQRGSMCSGRVAVNHTSAGSSSVITAVISVSDCAGCCGCC